MKGQGESPLITQDRMCVDVAAEFHVSVIPQAQVITKSKKERAEIDADSIAAENAKVSAKDESAARREEAEAEATRAQIDRL